ncbi:MAG: RnfABCDGE type electron transport complex subunit G [Lachnospiraceae bacterium]|nr:RnfABCDGE type electron transport complex subunit G [Lachnospiraceae bacterium]
MGSSIKNILCLTLITLAAGAGLGYVYDLTKEPIARMEAETRQAAYRSVFPEADQFTPLENDGSIPGFSEADENGCEIDSAVYAEDASGSRLGYVINVTSHEGYGGDITISMGIDNEGCVKGVEFLEISETAGLGMKAKEPAFKEQFRDRTVTRFSYTKTGAASDFEIDAISGATITTTAVTSAVNAGLEFYEKIGGAGI